MDTVRRFSRFGPPALVAVALIACRGDNAGKPPIDTAASGAVAQPEPATATARSATPVTAAPDARAICAGVVRFWGRYDSTVVRQFDSVTTPYGTDTAVVACIVQVSQEHGMRRAPKAPVDTSAQHLETALALVRGTGPGWIPLWRFSADGPDGSDLAYQRGRVRCLVEQSWDGGDDTDTTYVPADWFKEHTTCWLMPGGLAVSDTASG